MDGDEHEATNMRENKGGDERKKMGKDERVGSG